MARTRAADFNDKQKAILAAAAAVFASMGMEKASMAHVATHSNISKALLYHYYPSKDALIYDIVRSHLNDLDQAVKIADDPALTPDKRLKALVRRALQLYSEQENAHRVMLNSLGVMPSEHMDQLKVIERRIVRRFSAVINELNPNLSKKRQLLTPVTMSLFGIMNWTYTWFRPDGSMTREEFADVATAVVLDGLKALK